MLNRGLVAALVREAPFKSLSAVPVGWSYFVGELQQWCAPASQWRIKWWPSFHPVVSLHVPDGQTLGVHAPEYGGSLESWEGTFTPQPMQLLWCDGCMLLETHNMSFTVPQYVFGRWTTGTRTAKMQDTQPKWWEQFWGLQGLQFDPCDTWKARLFHHSYGPSFRAPRSDKVNSTPLVWPYTWIFGWNVGKSPGASYSTLKYILLQKDPILGFVVVECTIV